MSSRQNSNIVLLPIQPRYASAIADGGKSVEFRKSKFRERVSHVVVYSSSPIKKVLGYFPVTEISEMSPQMLWRRYKSQGGIDYKSFKEYYSGAYTGVAISIPEFFHLKKPAQLSDINPTLKAPQSFLYLSQKDFRKIKRLAR